MSKNKYEKQKIENPEEMTLMQKFNQPDISFVDYDDQVIFFNVIRDIFVDLNLEESKLPRNVFQAKYADKIIDVIEMSAGGCVPAQDYLCFLYKKGIDNVMPKNLVRAQQWGIIATANGSKLSIERLRLLFDPVYDYIVSSGKVEQIQIKNNLQDDELVEFISSSYCNLLMDKIDLKLIDLALKPLVSDDSLQRFMHELDTVRPVVLERLLQLIS